MSQYRKWDESRSPQWKYLLQKESAQRRKTRREIDHERRQTQEETVGKGRGSFRKEFHSNKHIVKDKNPNARKESKQELQEKLKYQQKQKKFNTTPDIPTNLYDDFKRPTQLFTEPQE